MKVLGRRQRGTSLIEALLALLLLSVSALGYAALQMQGVSRNASAMWRSKATQLAYEMSDRLRANQGGVAAGSYNSLISPQIVPSCGTNAPCSPSNMALIDYSQWSSDVRNALPGGVGMVCITSTPASGSVASPACDGAAGSSFAIKVFWTEKTTPSLFATVVRP